MISRRRQLSDLTKKINSNLRPVFTSKRIADEIKVTESKPPLINEQCVVFEYKYDLSDAGYLGYTCQFDSNLRSSVPFVFVGAGKERLIQLLDYSSAAP